MIASRVMLADDLLVDPERMVRVTYDHNGVPSTVVALSCGYVAARQGAKEERVVAVEVIFDPAIQSPHELPKTPYYCPMARLDRHLVPPKDLKKVSPALGTDIASAPAPSGSETMTTITGKPDGCYCRQLSPGSLRAGDLCSVCEARS